MFNRNDSTSTPSLEEITNSVNNPLWEDFCTYMHQQYHAKPEFTFSKCSWEYGWNIKFKKGSKSLCTVYPRENFFVLMVVIGKKEKTALRMPSPPSAMKSDRFMRKPKRETVKDG